MTPGRLRRYRSEDQAACLDLFDSNTPRYFAEAERPDYAAYLEALYPTATDEAYFVIEAAGQVVACGGLFVRPGETEAELAWGMVARAHHRQGYGRQLWQARLDWLGQYAPQVRVVRLDTTGHSAPFFARLGFVITQVQPDFYAPGLDRHDMRLDLPPAGAPTRAATMAP